MDIRLSVVLLSKTVVLEVWDCDPKPPVLQEVGYDRENGRGLFIVTMIADCWDYYPSVDGKVVWEELAIPTVQVDEVLPKRLVATELRGPRHVAVTNDWELLNRVRLALLAWSVRTADNTGHHPYGVVARNVR